MFSFTCFQFSCFRFHIFHVFMSHVFPAGVQFPQISPRCPIPSQNAGGNTVFTPKVSQNAGENSISIPGSLKSPPGDPFWNCTPAGISLGLEKAGPKDKSSGYSRELLENPEGARGALVYTKCFSAPGPWPLCYYFILLFQVLFFTTSSLQVVAC